MCLFLGWSVHNDVAFDNTAVWLHVVSNTRGAADRIGRIFPVLVLGLPLIAIGAPISALLQGDPDVIYSVIGVSSCILFAGLGISSLLSARFPYPAVRPGDSPFTGPQASGGAATAVQSVAFFITLLLSAPAGVFAVLGLLDDGYWSVWSLAAGLGIGLATLVLGIAVGGRTFERRGPNILAFTLRN
jgi:ABC-2 type transport system permease protein